MVLQSADGTCCKHATHASESIAWAPCVSGGLGVNGGALEVVSRAPEEQPARALQVGFRSSPGSCPPAANPPSHLNPSHAEPCPSHQVRAAAHTRHSPLPCRRPPRQGHGRTLLGKSVSHQPVFSSLCWFWRSPKCLFCRPSSIACPKHARDANMPPRSPGRAKPSPGPASQAIPAFPFPRAQCSTLPAHALRSRSSTELVAHHGFITGGTAGRGMMDDCSRELKAAPTNRRIDFAAGHASGIGGIGKLEGSRSLVHTYCGTEYRHLTG